MPGAQGGLRSLEGAAAHGWWHRTWLRIRTMATAVRMITLMRVAVASGAVVPCANARRTVARRVVVSGARAGTGGDVCAGDVTGGGTRS